MPPDAAADPAPLQPNPTDDVEEGGRRAEASWDGEMVGKQKGANRKKQGAKQALY